VQLILQVLPVREQLIVRLALFSGMRPSEIFALQWKHIADDHVEVVHRIYRGKLAKLDRKRAKKGSNKVGDKNRSFMDPLGLTYIFPTSQAVVGLVS
jgi:integrase